MGQRSRPRAAAAAWAVLLALAGCSAVAPPVHLHSLMPEELPRRSAPAGEPPLVISLEPVRLPVEVDQPQWLVRMPDGSLLALEQQRWASPLRDEFRQALLEELAAHSGVIDARTAPRRDRSPIRVDIDVRRFDAIVGREARLEGSWTLVGAARAAPGWRCAWLLREPASGGYEALAAAERRALVRLADGIGDSLRAMQRGSPPACPASDPR